VSDRKGVSVPDATLAIPALSAKDRDDLEFGLSLGVLQAAPAFAVGICPRDRRPPFDSPTARRRTVFRRPHASRRRGFQ
ncbi:hypothetical protein ACX84U_31240, partial [Burkholderia pseudomallei]